jgi:iron-sulfur cluster assembly accessory protein
MSEIRLSERAARRVAEILKSERADAALRVSVEGGGCSGFQYKFEIDSTVNADDLSLGPDDGRVLIDSMSQPFLAGAEIDFVDDLMGQSFRIANPNATSSCGCGTSFSI